METGIRAATDITGFALLGHGSEMAEKSGVRLRFSLEHLPFLPGAREYAAEWLFPGGSGRNRKCYGGGVDFTPGVPEEMRELLFTPETSGGLLAAVPPDRIERARALFAAARHPFWIVGEVGEGSGIEIGV